MTIEQMIEDANELYRQYTINFDGVNAVHINAKWKQVVEKLQEQVSALTLETDRLKAILGDTLARGVVSIDGVNLVEENKKLKTMGVIEVAIRNVNVASYVAEKEKRIDKLEQQIDKIKERFHCMNKTHDHVGADEILCSIDFQIQQAEKRGYELAVENASVDFRAYPSVYVKPFEQAIAERDGGEKK